MGRSWVSMAGAVVALAGLCGTPARAEPRISRLCADVVSPATQQVRYRATVQWNGTKPEAFDRFEVVAMDATGVYYPQFRNGVLKPGPKPSVRPFVETQSLYPLEFFAAGFTREAAEAFDRGCRRRASERVCYVTGNEPGVRIFPGSVFVPKPSANLLCRETPLPAGAARKGGTLPVALVVGNGRYSTGFPPPALRTAYLPDLATPVSDARTVRTALAATAEYQIVTGEDADIQNLNRLIVQSGELARSQQVSKVVVYFSGHGFRFGGETYLVPSGALLSLSEDLAKKPPEIAKKLIESSAIPLSRLISELPDSDDGFNLVILDICRDNPWGRELVGPEDLSLELTLSTGGPEEAPLKRNTVVLYSTALGASARDRSPYSAVVAKWLGQGGVQVRDWLRGFNEDAVAALGSGQRPEMLGTVTSSVCLGTCPK